MSANQSVNLYGDHKVETKGGAGIDVASQRADDLDKSAIAFVSGLVKKQSVFALDFGCGYGGQSLRMVRAGAFVTALDIADLDKTFSGLRRKYGFSVEQLSFIKGNMLNIANILSGMKFDVVCSQRAIHYVPYDQALQIMQTLRGLLNAGGKLFISATGVDTEIGQSCADVGKPISERFSSPSEEMAEKHNIHHPICVYSAHEMAELLKSSGFMVERVEASAFGNIKAIAS